MNEGNIMDMDISADELKLLAYLHEHVSGYGRGHGMSVLEIRAALGTDDRQFQKDASFLQGFGFVGTEGYQKYGAPTDDDVFDNSPTVLEIWLTSRGEQFMRALERALVTQLQNTPSKVKKITSKVVDFVYDAGKAIIIKTLTDAVSGRGH